MVEETKSKSPFYPGQPVPVELFVGRVEQLDRLLKRGVGQVAAGKPVSIYIQGEYGIGKSSIASFAQSVAERDYGLHCIYAPLGGATSIGDVGARILEATIRSGAFEPRRSEKIREWLGKYIGKQSLFGVELHFDEMHRDAPGIASGMLPFLNEIYRRLSDDGVKGVFLVLDEINGVASDPNFAHFIKGIVDTNAVSREPLPLLLALCGVEERRRNMIRNHPPIDRIFDVIDIQALSEDEMKDFFNKAFERANMTVEPEAMRLLCHYSAGFPKIMHLVGDSAYWLDRDGIVDQHDALAAVVMAADEVGKKYVDQQVYKALRSEDYRSIFKKIAELDPDSMTFVKADVEKGLSASEKAKFNNFLQKMKKIGVLQSGDNQGEYCFISRMVRLYIWLQSRVS
jgi:hypothetical protein